MAIILIVDDVKGVRLSIANLLKRSGHTVLQAGDGREGLAMALRERPDLMITDMLMPQQDGVETIHAVRAELGAGAPRILAISGGGSLVPSEQALHYARDAADAVLRKPFENAEFLETVDALLKEAAA
jgi:CheY-like chemotaxis protein